jgi:hypothetical protein
MIARTHITDQKLNDMLGRANLPAAKWPRGEFDGARLGDMLLKVLRRPGVWRLLGADLQDGIHALGLGPLVDAP